MAMKNSKAPGSDGIPVEVYKFGDVHRTLHKLLSHLWETEQMPQEFKDANIITIYKGKGDKSDCNNYRACIFVFCCEKSLD